MNKEIAIEIKNLSKMYNLTQVGTGTISQDLKRFIAKLRGKPDPYATLAELNDRTVKGTSNNVWVLQNIDLTVERGEVLGIIGRNGAGKSTLLKILSGITAPTTGNIKYNGRMASLLEVGTGMHPEMTARENVFLNGAIMGMTRGEIAKKLDDIVDFAGVVKYIDTPIKRFSSGMKVRLGFAVAAFLEPEILVVDEVLAVGDAEFQKRAVGKMQEVSKGGDRTVLFVSHNLAAVNSLCKSAVVMDRGSLAFNGNVVEAIDFYVSIGSDVSNFYKSELDDENDISEIRILNSKNSLTSNFHFDEEIKIRLKIILLEERNDNIEICIRIVDQREKIVFTTQKPLSLFTEEDKGIYTLDCIIPNKILVPNTYKPIIALHVPNTKILSFKEEVVSFTIEETGTDFHIYNGNDYGCVFVECKWGNA